MDDSYCLLPERISEQFSEIDSDIVMDLAAASPEYTELKAQMEELKRQNPVIGALLEGKGELSFTAEEHKALKEFIRLYMRADNMEREHIYFREENRRFQNGIALWAAWRNPCRFYIPKFIRTTQKRS